METLNAPQELLPVWAKRIDPATKLEYTLCADPIDEIDWLTLPPGTSAKDFVLRFFWQVMAGQWPIENLPDLKQDVEFILPLVSEVIESINLHFEPVDKDSNPGDKYAYFYSTSYGLDAKGTFIDDTNIIPPSNELLISISREVLESQAIHIAMAWYIEINKEKLNELADLELAAKEEFEEASSEKTSPLIRVDEKNTLWGMNAIGQMFGQTKVPSEPANEAAKKWQERFGQTGGLAIDEYGIDLNDIGLRVMEGLLHKLTKTNYEGNLPPTSKEDILEQFGKVEAIDKLPKAYQNVKYLPNVKIGKRELLRLVGMNYDDRDHVERVTKALGYLATTQFCFYYSRLAIGTDGKTERDPKTNDYKKEDVTSVDTLFKVKTVKDKATQEFKYYEVSPSHLFLDQKERYFMLIPFGWREEIKALVGDKKASSYLYLFLLYLRYQFEQKRRRNSKPKSKGKEKYEIVGQWLTIAQALRMPEYLCKHKTVRANEILENAYSVAQKLGYLTSYSRENNKDRLVLNPDKYLSRQPGGEA